MEKIKYADFISEAKQLFGDNSNKWKFKCCNCGHEQSIEDFKVAGIEDPENKVHFSCIGRWTNGHGELGNDKSPCNYTLGGLFRLNNRVVVMDNGDEVNVFDFGQPEKVLQP